MSLQRIATCVIFLTLMSAAKSSPPTIQQVFDFTIVPNLEITNLTIEDSFDLIAKVCNHLQLPNPGDVSIVIAGDSNPRVSVSYKTKNAKLQSIVDEICKKYALKYVFTEYTLVVGNVESVDRFVEQYKQKRVDAEDMLVMPRLDFRYATMEEVARFLTRKARDIDPRTKRIIKYIGAENKTVSIFVRNVPLSELLQELSAATNQNAVETFQVQIDK